MIKSTGLARRVSSLLKRAGVVTQHPERNRDGVTVRAGWGEATVRASFAVPIDHMDELVEVMESTLKAQGYEVIVRRSDEGPGHAAFLRVLAKD